MRGEIPPDPGEPMEDPLIGNVSKFDPMPIDDKSKVNTGWIDKWLIQLAIEQRLKEEICVKCCLYY